VPPAALFFLGERDSLGHFSPFQKRPSFAFIIHEEAQKCNTFLLGVNLSRCGSVNGRFDGNCLEADELLRNFSAHCMLKSGCECPDYVWVTAGTGK